MEIAICGDCGVEIVPEDYYDRFGNLKGKIYRCACHQKENK